MSDKKPDRVREQPITYNEYADLPDDGNRYELVDGILELMSPGSTPIHQLVGSEIMSNIKNTCKTDYIILYEVDIVLSNYEVRRPDIVMIHRNRLSIVTGKNIIGPPDLVIEIVSPSSYKRDKLHKRKVYASFSIQEYWIVDPSNGALEQYQLSDGSYELINIYTEDELIQSNKLPCIAFTMNDIMSGIPALADE